jgi:hypothetical protein
MILSYNGFTWPDGTKTKLALQFVADSSGRTVTHTICKLTVEGHITAGAQAGNGAAQEASLTAIRAALERPAGQLVYEGRGFGDLSINTAGARRDLHWGPFPKMLSFETMGVDYSAKVSWQVEVALLGCLGAPSQGEVMEFNYEVEWDRDRSGYTRRTFTGHLIIPMTRTAAASDRVPDSVDAYFDRFVPLVPVGFRREVNKTKLSEDRTRLDFTFTDEELPAPFPDNIVHASGSHTQENFRPRNFCGWNGSIEAEYEVAKGKPRGIAWNAFLDLLETRVRGEVANGPPGTFCAPVKLRFNEPLYDKRTASFTFNYFLVCGEKAVRDTPGGFNWFPLGSMWSPVAGNFGRWSASLADGAQNPRGNSKMKFDANADAIVDLCLNSGVRRLVSAGHVAVLQGQAGPIGTPWEELTRRLGVPAVPTPAGSWLHYEVKLIVEPDDNIIEHRPLAMGQLPVKAVPQSQSMPTFQFPIQISPPSIFQAIASPTYYVRLVGRALRLAYTIPAPSLVSVGGSATVPANSPGLGCSWSSWLAGFSTHEIYASEFSLRWAVSREVGTSGVVSIPTRPDGPQNILRGQRP